MREQVEGFRKECNALAELLESLEDRDFEIVTQFKQWTIGDVLRHLHVWNYAADRALMAPQEFDAYLAAFAEHAASGDVRVFERHWCREPAGRGLLDAWRALASELCVHFASADPKVRVRWVGPDMSARSAITARLMETWAHGQEVYDILGVERGTDDRIKDIAFLGVRTFEWTFRNRGLAVPGKRPYVRLQAPSGAVWEFGDPDEENRIEGNAVEFCQVVTQVRNVADTSLEVRGEVARRWMAIAQCFAGPPSDPPAPGTRFRVTRRG
ncbi:MAG: TIGR03084 family protein [Candidatus Dadabacteria bacterium]|nr:MAG: TIGR03084 family protein [Candidatus Dadabacteria bacterium]